MEAECASADGPRALASRWENERAENSYRRNCHFQHLRRQNGLRGPQAADAREGHNGVTRLDRWVANTLRHRGLDEAQPEVNDGLDMRRLESLQQGLDLRTLQTLRENASQPVRIALAVKGTLEKPGE